MSERERTRDESDALHVLAWLRTLSAERRANVFALLTEVYCPSCGKQQEEGRDHCACTVRRP